MRDKTLLRLSGVAAMGGALLRIADSFSFGATPQILDGLYFLTDVLLLLGLIGWYLSRAGKLGWLGLAGFVIAVTAILIIRSAWLFGPQGYMLGAGALLIGLAIMNLPTLLRRDGAITAPVLWLLSLGCGIAAPLFAPMTIIAGILFGLGFVAAGIDLWKISA